MIKLIVLFLTVNLCFADNSVKVIKKGESAPFDGVLFTRELEKDIRNDLIVYEKKSAALTRLNDINEKEIEILNKRLNLYQAKAKELAERETKAESDSFLKNATYFISGAIITGVIGYGVIKAYR
jgi:hypothetical protein